MNGRMTRNRDCCWTNVPPCLFPARFPPTRPFFVRVKSERSLERKQPRSAEKGLCVMLPRPGWVRGERGRIEESETKTECEGERDGEGERKRQGKCESESARVSESKTEGVQNARVCVCE